MIRAAAIAAAVAAIAGGTTRPAVAQPGRQPTADELAHESTVPPRIEVYTIGSGDRRVERFGHAAICVRWPNQPLVDRCYNYGTTDFAAPASMLWGFIRGDAEFWVEAWSPGEMLDYYRRRDRSIWRQVLDDELLSGDARLAIARKLAVDARVENRYYRYHHFDDNCTTRVREIVDEALGGRLREAAVDPPDATFRDLGYAGFASDPWLVAVMDFAIGGSADARPTAWQAMFLPRYLRAALAELGAAPEPVYARRGPPLPTGSAGGRIWAIAVALAIGLPALLAVALRRRQRLGLAISAGILGSLGLLLWLAAIVSPMAELRYNEAVLVLVPTDLALVWLTPARRQLYARIRLVMLVAASLLVAVGLFRSSLWVPILAAFPTLLVAALEPRRG